MPLTLEQSLDMQIESKTEDAVRILTHYLKQAIPDLNSDAAAEMRDVVESIVDVACCRIARERLPRLRPAHGDTFHASGDVKCSGRAEITPLGSKALHSEDGFEVDRPGPEFGA